MSEMRYFFDYDYQMQNLDDIISRRFLSFCTVTRKFPKTVGVSRWEAGYHNSLMRTVIDPKLAPELFWLSEGEA
jgi:hypothetical protein